MRLYHGYNYVAPTNSMGSFVRISQQILMEWLESYPIQFLARMNYTTIAH